MHVEAVADARARTQAPPSTILVVDDNPVNLQLVVRTLDGSGHRILAARNGTAALEIARRAAPDLVLLDILMPDMSGFDVYQRLNARPDAPPVPVIFLSALDDAADKIAGLGLGAVDYVTKPIQPEEVRARVDNHLTRLFLERELRRNRDRLDRELADAAELQRLMLPQAMPPGFAAHYRTSRHAGGDYYDVKPLDDGRFSFIVADVSGHGASAAIVMAMIRTLFHALDRDVAADPAAALRSIDGQFGFLRDSAVFATAAYGVVDTARRTMCFASAGHPLPLLSRSGEETAALACEGALPLLFADPAPIPIAEHRLAAGDRILFYTDGITDRQSPSAEMYDPDRLAAALTHSARRDARTVIEQVVADIEGFARGAEPADDQTLLAIAID
jgi:sigma-B regulation protein RsbU (phosphoserine phosphatase)